MEFILAYLPIASLVTAIGICGCLAFYDFRQYILPDSLNLALALSALAYHWSVDWSAVPFQEAILGAFVGAGALLAVKLIYEYTRQKRGLGLGDVKFMIGAGLWVGIWQIPMLIAIASLSTLATIFFLRTAGLLGSKTILHRHFPFGPGLCVALVLLILDMSIRR